MAEDLTFNGKPQFVGLARTPQGVEISTAILNGTARMSTMEFRSPRIDFADLKPMVDTDSGNIGSGILKRFAVTLDQNNHRLRFQRPEVLL